MAEEDYLLDRLLCALAVPAARCATVDTYESLMGSIFDWSSHESQVNTQILFPGSTLAHKPQPTYSHPPGDKLHTGSLMQHDLVPQYVNVQPAAATAAGPGEGQIDGQWMLLQQRPQMQPTPTHAYGYSIQTSVATDHARPVWAESTLVCNTPELADNSNWQTVLQQQQHQHIVQQQQILSHQTSQQLPQAQMVWAAMQQQQQSYQPQQLQQQQQRQCHSQVQLPQQQVLLQQPFGATTDPAQPEARLPATDAPGNSSSIEGSGRDDAASLSHQRQQQQQPAPRGPGRPPKKSGNYGKVYLATKRYRQRKQSMVSQLQSDVASKVKELQLLEEEQQSLLRKHEALSSAISLHEDLLEHLTEIKISEDDHGDHHPDLDHDVRDQSGGFVPTTADRDTASTAAAAAADSVAATATPTEGTMGLEAATVGDQHLLQQQQHQMHTQEPFSPHILTICARYKKYVTIYCARAAAADIAAATAAIRRSSKQKQQSSIEAIEYPAFPLNLVESMEFFNLLGYHSNNSSCARSAPGWTAGQPVASYLVNMDTGKHDAVQPEFWVKVAQQVVLTREQKHRMAAAYKLLAAAVAKQNQDRLQLQQQLQELLNTDAAASFDICKSSSRAGAMPAHSTAAAASGNAPGDAAAAGAVTKGSTLASTIDFFQQYHQALDRVDWNMTRGRTLLVLYGWSLLEVLTNKQKAQLCMASWPYFPVLRAVFGNLLGAFMHQQEQQQ